MYSVFRHQLFDAPQFPRTESQVVGERDRLQPELGRVVVTIHVDVSRLVRLMAVEVQTIGARSATPPETRGNSRLSERQVRFSSARSGEPGAYDSTGSFTVGGTIGMLFIHLSSSAVVQGREVRAGPGRALPVGDSCTLKADCSSEISDPLLE